MREFFSFPNPVNEKAARTVAAGVFAAVIVTLISGWYWLLIPITYGFWARVLAGPRLSPLGWTAMNVVAPRLGEKRYVSGPPKRFAQGIGTVISSAALIFALILGDHAVADVLLCIFIVAAGVEALFGYCLGCKLFGVLMHFGLVPREVCAECADISGRLGLLKS